MFDFGISKQALQKVLGINSQSLGISDSQVITNKDFDVALNNLIQTTPGLGAILVDNGTKIVARARPAANLPLHGKSDGSDIEYSKLEVAGGGTGQVTLSSGAVLIGAGTSGITTKANPAGAFMGLSDVQVNTGLKTFQNSTFGVRNPLDTKTLTYIGPSITTDQDYRFNSNYAYLIFKEGTTYYAKSGKTKGIEFSNSVADIVIQSAITAVLASAKGGIIQFSADTFPIVTPLDIPGAVVGGVRPILFRGTPTAIRDYGTVFSVQSSFPTGRYIFETSGVTDLSDKFCNLYFQDLGSTNINHATTNAGFLKYEADNAAFRRTLGMDRIFGQYMWRGVHLIGSAWWCDFNDLNFGDASSGFTGDADMIMEKGTHTGGANKWPKFCNINRFVSDHGGGSGGTMANALRILDGGYNQFNWTVEGTKYTEAVFALKDGFVGANVFFRPAILDLTTPTPDNRVGSVLLSGANCYANKFIAAYLPRNGPTASGYQVAIKSGSFRNDIELAGFWGSTLSIDNVGCGDYNIIKIFTGSWDGTTTPYGNVMAKPTLSGNAAENARLRIIDERLGAYQTGVSTQSGDASTKAFNIAHGCYTTPLTYSVQAQTNDAVGPPTVTATSTNLVVTYPVAPPSGSSNLIWVWKAGVY
jgi:hypothetical protein